MIRLPMPLLSALLAPFFAASPAAGGTTATPSASMDELAITSRRPGI